MTNKSARSRRRSERLGRITAATMAMLLVLSLAGCAHLTTHVGAPLPPRHWLSLTVGTSSVGDVLRALGPPTQMSATGSGFAMLYEHELLTENQIGFYVPYGILTYLKFVYGKTTLDHQCWAMTFDSHGMLTGWGEEHRSSPFGTGFAMQILVASEALVDSSEFTEYATQHLWGEACLDPLPQALNHGHSVTNGAHGLEQKLAPVNVGQHALEMTSEESHEAQQERRGED